MSKQRKPSLQNLPLRTEQGKKIRDAFVEGTPPIIECDYAELEKRIVSGIPDLDEALKGGFKPGELANISSIPRADTGKHWAWTQHPAVGIYGWKDV